MVGVVFFKHREVKRRVSELAVFEGVRGRGQNGGGGGSVGG